MPIIPTEIATHLAWQFDTVLPGVFRRDKKDYAEIDFPILAPLPHKNAKTEPQSGALVLGPFIYFVVGRDSEVRYVGKSKEKTVVKRWVRPGIGGPATHYWTHTNKRAGCIRRIAEGIVLGRGPFQLRFLSIKSLAPSFTVSFAFQYPRLDALDQAELGLISLLRPEWNDSKTYR